MEVLVQTIAFTRAFARVVVLGFTMATKCLITNNENMKTISLLEVISLTL
jgi:hypothetical protein